MLKPIPPPQYWWSGDAEEWAAEQLGIPYDVNKVDWPWEVAEEKDLDRYFQLYSRIEAHAPACRRIVVMEMILEAASNGSLSTVEFQQVWPRINALLNQDADILARTALYWGSWHIEEQEVEEYAWRVAPYMRNWWRANYPIPTEADRMNMGVI